MQTDSSVVPVTLCADNEDDVGIYAFVPCSAAAEACNKGSLVSREYKDFSRSPSVNGIDNID